MDWWSNSVLTRSWIDERILRKLEVGSMIEFLPKCELRSWVIHCV